MSVAEDQVAEYLEKLTKDLCAVYQEKQMLDNEIEQDSKELSNKKADQKELQARVNSFVSEIKTIRETGVIPDFQDEF